MVTVYYPSVRHSLATPIIPTPRARAHAGLMRRSSLRTRNSLWIRKRYRLNANRVRVHRVQVKYNYHWRAVVVLRG